MIVMKMQPADLVREWMS